MYSTITSGAVHGINSYLVSVEVNIANGLPVIDMVGSLSGEVKEARERVRVALHNSGFPFPASRITVNLSPANIRKEGSAFDLPIAVGILKSMERVQICEEMQNALFLGELGLNGEVRFSRGVLPIVLEARKKGIRHCFVPYVNQGEAEVAEGICVHGVSNLRQVLDILEGRSGQTFEAGIKYGKKGEKREKRKEGEEGAEWVQGEAKDHEEWEEGREESTGVNGQIKRKQREAGYGREMQPVGEINNKRGKANEELDFAQIKGQEILKKAAMISAAGFHHVLIVGPPGVGKTMIAKRMPTILPPMSLEECLEVTKIYSVSGLIHEECPLIRTRPFMSPHHT
ncbi:MAG: ATP-binding protein, partial [Lachnospiraceae bacterium]|nr:ATP-binding protein [Lachnospiraceae bacterium]